MIHPVIEQHLSQLGLNRAVPPNAQQWETFLKLLSQSNQPGAVHNNHQSVNGFSLTEERFQHLLSSLHIGIIVQGADTRILLSNPMAAQLLGQTQEQLRGKTSFDLDWQAIHEDGSPLPGSEHPVSLALATGQPVHNVVMGVYHPVTQNYVWLLVNAAPVLDENGSVVEIICTFDDITAYKSAEQAQYAAERDYREMFENAAVGMYRTNFDGQLIRANPALVRLNECESEAEALALFNDHSIAWYADPNRRSEFKRLLERDDKITGFESEVYGYKTRKPMWVSESAWIVRDAGGNLLYYEGMIQDVTERKRADEALRAIERDYHQMFENAAIGMYRTNFNAELVRANPALVHLANCDTEAELLALLNESSVAWYVDRNRHHEFRHQLQRDNKITNFESEVYRFKTDERMWISESAWVMRDQAGRPLYYEGTVQDITERKRAEDALRQNEERYRAISQVMSDYIYQFVIQSETEAYPEWMLGAYEQITGYSIEEVMQGSGWGSLLHPDDEHLMRQHRRQLMNGERAVTDLRIIARNGDIRWLRLYGQAMPDRTPEGLVRVYAAAQDITERRQIEEALRQSEEQYRAVTEVMSDYVYSFRVLSPEDTEVEWLAGGYERITGYSVEEVLKGEGWTHITHPDDMPIIERRLQKLLTGEKDASELRIITKNGDIRWLRLYGQPIWDDAHTHIVRVYAAGQDITERKRMEEVIHDSEAKNRALLNAIPDIMTRFDHDGHYLEFRMGTATDHLEDPPPSVIGKTVYDFLPPELAEKTIIQIHTALSTGSVAVLEYPLQQSSGEMRVFESRVVAYSDDEVLALIRDITERKHSEAALLQSEAEQRTLLNLAQRQTQALTLLSQVVAAVARELDLPTLIRTVVESTANTFGYALVSLYMLQGNTLVLQHEVGYESVITHVPINKGVSGRVARTGKPILVPDVQADPEFMEAIDGIVSEICVPLMVQNQVVGIFNVESTNGVVLSQADLDLMITLGEHISIAIERARLYATLVETKEQYQTVVDNIHEVIFQLDEEARWVFLNPAWTELTGFTVEESIGQFGIKYVHQDDVAKTRELRNALLNREADTVRVEQRWRSRDGGFRWVEVSARRAAASEGIIGTLTDITERKQAERQSIDLAVERKTVQALRQFLSDISHDLRTPVSVISTSTYLLRKKLGDSSLDLRHLDVLDEQIIHLTRLLEDMLDIARLDEGAVEHTFINMHLNRLVQTVVDRHNHASAISHHVLAFAPGENVPVVSADPMFLEKAIRNILENAMNHTPAGVAVVLRTRVGDKGGAILEIEDSGPGIDPEDLPYIFDRFYRADKARPTNKGGAGLGLPIAQKIVEAHGGKITVESTPGQGTIFRLWLPSVK